MPSLGAYVIGALDDAERALLDAHLAGCAECRDELERLLPLPRYLACVAAEEAERFDSPPAGLFTRLSAAVRSERRRLVRRRIAGLAAVAMTVAVAAAAVLPARGGVPSPARAASVAAADPQSGVSAAVTLTPRAWGTELSVRMDGAAPGEQCRLVVRGRDGASDVAGTWRATYQGSAGARGSTAMPRADVTAIDVVTTAGRRLVHVPVPPFDRSTAQEEAS
jgi:hypothetical protein